MKRRVFFCSIGGFDTHGIDQLADQAELLAIVSDAMAFYRATRLSWALPARSPRSP